MFGEVGLLMDFNSPSTYLPIVFKLCNHSILWDDIRSRYMPFQYSRPKVGWGELIHLSFMSVVNFY